MIACAHRIPRPGPSNVARNPSPAVSISRPRNRASWPRTRAWCASTSVLPRSVAQARSGLGRADDVGEQHGREEALQRGFLMLELAHEPFDLRQHRVVLGDPEEVLVAGELDEPRSRDPRSELPHPHDGELHVLGLGDHQGRDVDRGESVAHVDLPVHPRQGDRGSGARRPPQVRGEPRRESLVIGVARRAPHGDLEARVRDRAPVLVDVVQVLVTLGDHRIVRLHRRVIRIGAVEHQRDRPLGVRRGEQHRHRAALRDPEHHRTLRSRRVHHGAHVVHPRLHRWQLGLGDPVREPHAALVEQDQPAEGRERREEPSQIRLLPHRLDVAGPAHHPHEVHRSIADDLVGDVHPVGGLGEPRLRHPHARHHPIEAPPVGDALQLVLAGVLEREAGPCDQILHGLGDHDLRRPGSGCHAGADRDGEPATLRIDHLALPGVDAGAHLDAQVADALDDLHRAPDRARRAVEGRVEPVAGRVVLDPSPACERLAHHRVVTEHELLPRPVTERRLALGRADDVREQHRRQDGVDAGPERRHARPTAGSRRPGHPAPPTGRSRCRRTARRWRSASATRCTAPHRGAPVGS